MPLLHIVLDDGREEAARSYQRADGRVRIVRADGSSLEVAEEEVDLLATFERNAGVEFEEPPPAFDPGGAVLELRSRNEGRSGGYVIVEGVVANLSDHRQSNIVARVSGLDDAGGHVTAEEALIDWSPLEVGAESPFRVVLKSGGRIKATRLEFRVLLGEAVAYRVAKAGD